jgi:hypothetical protein
MTEQVPADGGVAGNGAAGAPGAGGDGAEALGAAQRFLDAVIWGDHRTVWNLIGSAGRTEVLEVATKRGMDEGLAARLASDSASENEFNEFLTDLVNGLRAELSGNDLDHVTYELDAAESGGGRAKVVMFVPLHPALGGTLPIGHLELVTEGDVWKVERLLPLTSK